MSRPISVHDLLFAFDFPPMGGGIARWMAELARGYPAGELTVSTGTLPGWEASDASQPNRIDRIHLAASRLKTVQGMLRWSRRAGLLAADPAARFAWCGNVRPAGYPVRWAFERTGLPYGIIVHGGDLLSLQAKFAASPLKRRSYRPVLEAASIFVANSTWTASRCRELLSDLGLAEVAGRIRVVALGTDPARFRPDADAAEAFRLRRGLPNGRWLVTVARLVPHKGIDTGVELLAALEAYPALQYLVVGRGSQEAALRSLAESRGVADRVHILTDVSDEELPAAYALGEIYLGLSREAGLDAEGFGIALLEAAASGLPVVAGASGGISDAVADGESGVLVDPGDHRQAADVVRQLLGNSSLAHTLGKAGRARVLRQFTWERVVTDLRAIAIELGRR